MDKIAKGYLEAARMIAQGEEIFSCNAVLAAFDRSGCGLRMKDKYLAVFCPNKGRHYDRSDALMQRIVGGGRNNMGDWPGKYNGEDNLRVLLLALMAACWKDFQ